MEQKDAILLKDLLAGTDAELVRGTGDERILTLSCDSRESAAGTLFAALPSATENGVDGSAYAGAAYAAGARAFLADKLPEALEAKTDIAVAISPDPRRALARIAASFFGQPASRVKLTALTGTKGKTTISFMLQSIFAAAGENVGLIGSNGVFYGDVWFKLPNTTPEPIKLHSILRDMADAGIGYVFLEATSQGFYMHRTDGIEFDLALYTNISEDHISKTEHPSFEHYFACKQRIFSQTEVCIVNRDAERFNEIISGSRGKIITYGFAENAEVSGAAPDYLAKDIVCEMKNSSLSVSFTCAAPNWSAPITLKIPGKFNAGNALAAIAIADYYGIDKKYIQEGLSRAVAKGRMEPIEVPAPYTVLIDFAHNRLSMESLMETAKAYEPKRILCVFGLEGNRAHIRRFDSGEILGRDCDYTILANASPRTDDPAQILNDIATGIERAGGKERYEIIPDRREAILKMLSMAREGDLVLLVGKGNVPYEEVNGVNIPFSEREVVEEFFKGAKK